MGLCGGSDFGPLGITVVKSLLNCFPSAVGARIAAFLVRPAYLLGILHRDPYAPQEYK